MTVARIPIEQRFWPKVGAADGNGCWPWTGAMHGEGYGTISSGGKGGRTLLAHRVSYELLVGQIPAGLVIDHLCRNRACVNPAHMEPVTNKVNILRGVSFAARFARLERCDRGHEFHVLRGGRRVCKECHRERDLISFAARGYNPPRVPPPPGDPRHGLTAYGDYYRCRCQICREAWAAYNRTRRAERFQLLAAGLIEVTHGTSSTYTNYGCRCDACRGAEAERFQRRKESRSAVTYGSAP